MIICRNCGNTSKFKRIAVYREWSNEEQFVDGDTEFAYDYGKSETTDSERQHYEDYSCLKCESEIVEHGLDKLGILKIQAEYTGENGEWYKFGVENDNKNKKILMELAAIMV